MNEYMMDHGIKSTADNGLSLEVSLIPVINFALHRNGMDAVKNVMIHNTSDKVYENAELRITSQPEVIIPFSASLSYIPQESDTAINPVHVMLDPEYLAGVTERVTAVFTFGLYKDGEILTEKCEEVTILAYDEWHGYGYYPELLCSFTAPNHPLLARIIGRAAQLLGEWTGDPSLDAYQTKDNNRVIKQAAAVYSAIVEEQIVYCVPPASFETVGQRVRLADTVLGQKLGTCLDLTLLYTSCLEAIGLNPLMILTKGHIFSGVWLDDLSFPETVQDDRSVVTKRLADGVSEIAVVETTLVTSGKNASFDDARASAEKAFTGEDSVEYIIDVKRARLSGIRPLPQKTGGNDRWYMDEESAPVPVFHAEPSKAGTVLDTSFESTVATDPKIAQWERKLLDLGLRNNLINLRFSKTLVPILSVSLDDLEDALHDGSDFSILPRPADLVLSGDELSFENAGDPGNYGSLIHSEFINKRLRSVYTEAQLSDAIKGLYRAARTSIEENGANTLYLALGLLKWYENTRSTKPRYAPTVLIPVEIVRKSANKGYVIRLRDDEPQMNITILEKLKQDFGIVVEGLDPLPADEHGVDLRMVFTILRKAIMEQPRWDVLESAYIGIFSFSQFVMWNDMHSRFDDLMRSDVVRSLMEGRPAWDAKPMEMGDRVPEDGVYLPMSADASQLFAIMEACKGESFVLHGPPGTGKSQTITSLIANALAQGKSVLFVAEKMAALEVVQKRLEKIGIGAFCLELHSNKSKKRDVLEQLRRATEITKYTTSEQYALKADQIAKLRFELDSYALRLHEKLPSGYMLYELINGYEDAKAYPELEIFTDGFVSGLTRGTVDEHIILLERLVAAGRAAGDPVANPLHRIGICGYTQHLRTDAVKYADEYRMSLAAVARAYRIIADTAGVFRAVTFDDVAEVSSVASELRCLYDLPHEWSCSPEPAVYMDKIREMAEHYRNAREIREKILLTRSALFLEQDSQSLLDEYTDADSKWFIGRKLALNKLYKKLSVFSTSASTKDGLVHDITNLASYHSEKRAADEIFGIYGNGLGSLYSGIDTDWQRICELADGAKNSIEALENSSVTREIRERMFGDVSVMKAVAEFLDGYEKMSCARVALYTLLEIYEDASVTDFFDSEEELCLNISSNADRLKEWVAFNGVALETEKQGLGIVADAYKKGLSHEDVTGSYKRSVFRHMASLVIDSDNVLSSFSGAVFDEKVEQLRRIDTEMMELSRREIYCRLASRVPDFTASASVGSELGILQRNIRSGGRGTSIRKLFEDTANLIPRLCPCMLMSPMSAAQYLDPAREAFDIVVFDEASQLPTCKAVGVIARGKSAVIVGDPKQMPPTSFFATNTVDEDNLDIEDLESILDDCLSINMPQTHLLWHYRSRHESLIAFSNNQFYENRLYTFPSVNDRQSKVSLIRVDGIFDRGHSRCNREEAKAVVDEIYRRYADPELSKYSIGVVTFNISQQHLIDDILSERTAADPDFDKWVYESSEPLFIKNLENVQGDERDVILFSIGYGPDKDGKVYMNFGPLNREGGWRRLNVAVSRSRHEMIVFSTLTADMINLSRTNAEGVAALKSFLEYAAGGKLAERHSDSNRIHYTKNGIAHSICEYLRENGYETQMAVGHSEYRIDIGVIDRDEPERYVLGILLDGESYGKAKTVRDREISQISVLEGLGWTIHRVWSLDWWDNADKELSRILDMVKAAEKGSLSVGAVSDAVPVPESFTIASAVKVEEVVPSNIVPYKTAEIFAEKLSAEDFVLPQNKKAVVKVINSVMSVQAPISRGMLTRKVVQVFGITRAGTRIHEYLDNLYTEIGYTVTRYSGTDFLWNAGQIPSEYKLVRVSAGYDKREPSDIPIEEALSAVCIVLEAQISLGEEDLIRESAKLMGYTRTGGNLTSLIGDAIEYARETGKIKQGTNGNFLLS